MAFNKHHRIIRKKRNESWADFIGLRGREYKLRRWATTFVVTLILLGAAIVFLLRVLR